MGPVGYDDWYEMQVSAHGDTFDVYLDGVYEHTGTDVFIPAGAIGLYGESLTVAHFEDVRVRKYTALQPTVTLMLGSEVPSLLDPNDDLFFSMPAVILVALMIAFANMAIAQGYR